MKKRLWEIACLMFEINPDDVWAEAENSCLKAPGGNNQWTVKVDGRDLFGIAMGMCPAPSDFKKLVVEMIAHLDLNGGLINSEPRSSKRDIETDNDDGVNLIVDVGSVVSWLSQQEKKFPSRRGIATQIKLLGGYA